MCECTALQQLRGAPDTPSWNDLYHFMNHISTVSFSTARLFFPSSHESVRQDVECRRWSGGFPSEWGGRGGLDSKSGLQWEGRGHVPVCSHCGDGSSSGGGGVGAGGAGSSGVIHSYHHIHSCCRGAEWEDEGMKSHDVHSSGTLDLELNGGTMRWILLNIAERSTAQRWLPGAGEWMSFTSIARPKNFPRMHKKVPIKLSSLNVTVSAVHTNPEFSPSHTVFSSVRWLKSGGDSNLFNLQSGDDVDLRNTIRSCRLEILKHNLRGKCWQRTLSFPLCSTLNVTLSATTTSLLLSIIYFIYFITVFLQLVHFAPQVFVFVLHVIQYNILSPITMSWKLLCWWHWNNIFTHQSNLTFGEIPSH